MTTAVQWSESKLVRRTREADPQAFAQLLHNYQERVTRVLFPILKNSMDVEEVAQDVFLKIYAHRDRFDLKRDIQLST